MSEKNALIFIPDISGFTRFVNETEIQHSQHIIEELLEVLLTSNEIDLQVSEIEGDAVLFYKLGEAPDPAVIARQSRIFFLNFHNYLKQIEKDSVCQCGACRMASKLTLKFLLHYGEIGISQIREFTKIVGKNVILIHRLMKNNVKSDAYLLMTEAYTSLYPAETFSSHFNWAAAVKGTVHYDHVGEVNYTYIELSSLRSQVTAPSPPKDAKKFKNPLNVSVFIASPVNEVYNTVIDLAQRMEWSEGLNKITYDKGKIHRIGMKHICELPIGTVELETIQNKLEDGKIEYAEKAAKSLLFPQATTFFIMEREPEGTKFTIQFHYKRIFILGYFLDLIFRKRLGERFEKSAWNLKRHSEKQLA